MLESKAEVQALVKHLLENPKDIKSFQENPETLLTKFGIKSLDNKLLARIRGLDIGSIMKDGGHDECTSHCDFTKLDRISTRVSIDFNVVVKNIIKQLIVNENDIISFKANPNALFAEYGIAPNQELVNIITRSLSIGNIEPSDPNPWLDNSAIGRKELNTKIITK